jgi:hypothetical protein
MTKITKLLFGQREWLDTLNYPNNQFVGVAKSYMWQQSL